MRSRADGHKAIVFSNGQASVLLPGMAVKLLHELEVVMTDCEMQRAALQVHDSMQL